MDGYELTQRIRAIEASDGGARVPIVAVTANVMKGEEQNCLAKGMDAYLAKPISIERLKTTLERWLPIGAEDTEEGGAELPAASEVLDRSVLKSWLGHDGAAIHSLLAKFRDTAIEAERDLDGASRRGDLAALTGTAHRLKGAAEAVGAIALGRRALTLEQAGRAGDWSLCRGELGPLAADIRRVVAEIDAEARSEH
jgi:HPt (histidine-containing phosphotransfer) domain-containing protein